jgi:hypothetical protein
VIKKKKRRPCVCFSYIRWFQEEEFGFGAEKSWQPHCCSSTYQHTSAAFAFAFALAIEEIIW